MPELPEVETVRRGLAQHLVNRTIIAVEISHPRTVRSQAGGTQGLIQALVGRRISAVARRGKYLWFNLDNQLALVGHLGMSGQFLWDSGQTVQTVPTVPGESLFTGPFTGPWRRHERARILLDDGSVLHFIDQRTFGQLLVSSTGLVTDGFPAGAGTEELYLPEVLTHVARDLLDPASDWEKLAEKIKMHRTQIKKILLDQSVVSGIGNIYADEALWAARIHGAERTDVLSLVELKKVLGASAQVMQAALEMGGTSFDALYVDVTGNPGWFSRSLNVYGRNGKPCRRCQTLLSREVIGGRSHVFCAKCQAEPRK